MQAYERAVAALSNHSKRVESGKEAQKLPGIGKKIGIKIDEILRTGRLKSLDEKRKDPIIVALRLFLRIHGVGPVLARKLVLEFNARNMDDLQRLISKKTFVPTPTQAIGIKYVDEFAQRIPRAEVAQLERVVLSAIANLDPRLKGVVCGSYRRGRENSGDIDVLLTHPNYTLAEKKRKKKSSVLASLVRRLHDQHFLTDDLSLGPTKYMGVCMLPPAPSVDTNRGDGTKHDGGDARVPSGERGEEEEEESTVEEGESTTEEEVDASAHPVDERLHRRIDMVLIPAEEFPVALLYFTGSGFFNTQMRTIAQERGFTLNEHALRPLGETGVPGEPIPVESEEDIFEILGMAYRTPAERDL